MKETKDGSSQSPVCCMCGDHGLPQELFRCKYCRVRLQHRYCSDLYPRVTAYRACNWCLREEGGSKSLKLMANRKTMMSKPSSNNRHDGCSRSAFSSELGKPIKKPKVDERILLPDAMKRNKLKEGKPRQFRVKVRRYKLLEEVTC